MEIQKKDNQEQMRQMAREMLRENSSLFFNAIKFEHAQRVATMLSSSTMVPEHFRNNLGNCMIALNYAERLGVDPFMLMQTMCVVHGRPGIEGKTVIALINKSGLFTGPLEWEFSGKKGTPDWKCTAYATHKATNKRLELSIDWATVKAEGWEAKNGSKWKSIPEVMFRYRTASWFANAYCPEVKLGLQTAEELQDSNMIDVTPKQAPAIEDLNQRLKSITPPTEDAWSDKEAVEVELPMQEREPGSDDD